MAFQIFNLENIGQTQGVIFDRKCDRRFFKLALYKLHNSNSTIAATAAAVTAAAAAAAAASIYSCVTPRCQPSEIAV